MRTALLATCVLLLAGAAASPAAEAHCAPPCGPIPVVIEIKTSSPKFLAFEAQDRMVIEGTVSYYVNIDGDGFWFDPQKPPELTFRVNRQPPWVKAKVEPDHYTVPLSDPQFVSQEGAPDQLQFYWEAPVKITVAKQRDPTPEEIRKGAGFVRGDGTYRVLVSASTTSSVLAPEAFGPNMGVQEGYGVKELRIVPEINGVKWMPNAEGALVPTDGIVPQEAKGAASAPMAVLTLLLLVCVAAWARRRA